MKCIQSLLVVFLFALLHSCNRPVMCTEEFRSIGIMATGKTLTDFYTMRESNGEKITHPKESIPGSDNYYTVLTDLYQKQLADKTEKFWFKGYINDSLVINEPFVISADQCHISYVSGKTEVQL